ncbi:hypothetical protein BCV69DRAFT_280171 [Microstroma glucosiphilum]|uniref:Uncharacterized protein n=1 Tax=Pseudomicrostroma glucosiphilum TaxID=1684307 RepID=A0A316UGA7_9BASI|nr:hypothetical protein BCV69DRAFT_280171 [Pseudomicrostroma glucosiphilum]PWN24279.1 hypothetical protein BCV69DRAFT_280171 [Pseudomicrostroma glucosiphilum]
MRATFFFTAVVALASATIVAAQEAADLEERSPVVSKVFGRAPFPQVTPEAIEERQLGGGEITSTTSLATLQTISGYTPPASTRIPTPVVSSGTILSAAQIPGYNDTVKASGADMLNVDGRSLALAGGMAAAAAYLLF